MGLLVEQHLPHKDRAALVNVTPYLGNQVMFFSRLREPWGSMWVVLNFLTFNARINNIDIFLHQPQKSPPPILHIMNPSCPVVARNGR